VTTVFARQGHYARDPQVARYPRPDLTIDRIGELRQFDLAQLHAAAPLQGTG
jgi:hypothetical protein